MRLWLVLLLPQPELLTGSVLVLRSPLRSKQPRDSQEIMVTT